MKKVKLETELKNQSNDAYVNPVCIVVRTPVGQTEESARSKKFSDIRKTIKRLSNKKELA